MPLCGKACDEKSGLEKTDGALMKEKIKLISAVFTFVSIFAFSGVSFSEEIIQRLDGKIARTDEIERTLVVDFEHPATGEQFQKKFVVRDGAGFKDFKKLSQLKKGDLISLDYVESSPVDTAVYVMHIPLEKTYFNPGEIVQALVQIKNNPKR
jgi:hypothetical protein